MEFPVDGNSYKNIVFSFLSALPVTLLLDFREEKLSPQVSSILVSTTSDTTRRFYGPRIRGRAGSRTSLLPAGI